MVNNIACISSIIACSYRIVYRYEGKTLELGGKGENLEEFFEQQETYLPG